MHRTLERLDAAASTIVPLAYLAGLMLGTMAYFTGVTLNLGLAVGVALAIAAECHAFLEQRRCRALYSMYGRMTDADQRQRLAGQLRLHVGILAALVAFSAVNATAFATETWRPAPTFLLPNWLQIGIRGAVVPAFFLLTGALSPLSVGAGDELASASRSMLRRTLRATLKQWNARIDTARRTGVDLAPVAVSLMLDAGDLDGARRVQLIAHGLDAAERGALATSTAALSVPAKTTTTTATATATAIAEEPPSPAPTEPNTPAARRPRASKRTGRGGKQRRPVLRLTSSETAEERLRMLLADEPALPVRQLASRAHVSESTASKWRRIVAAERAGQGRQAVAQ